MNKIEIILKAFDIMVADKIWHDVTASQLLRILMYLNSRNWLHFLTVDGEYQAVVAAYRIKEISDQAMTIIPENEEGNILYIPMVISLKKEGNMYKIVRESTRMYLEQNPDITQIVLEDKNEKLKVYNIKGEHHGEIESSRVTTAANV